MQICYRSKIRIYGRCSGREYTSIGTPCSSCCPPRCELWERERAQPAALERELPGFEQCLPGTEGWRLAGQALIRSVRRNPFSGSSSIPAVPSSREGAGRKFRSVELGLCYSVRACPYPEVTVGQALLQITKRPPVPVTAAQSKHGFYAVGETDGLEVRVRDDLLGFG